MWCARYVTLLLLTSAVAGCSDVTALPEREASVPSAAQVESLFISQPTIRPNPIKRAPLIAIVEFESTQAVEAVVQVDDGKRKWERPWKKSSSNKHAIAVMGLRPDRKHSIRIRVQVPGTDKHQTSEPLSFHTPPLPKSFPPLKTLVSIPEEMEPGITLFAVNLWRKSVSMLDYGYIVALDSEGEVVWYCHTADRIADMRVLKNGHLVYQQGSYRYAYEIDLLGRDHRRWVATNLTESPSQDSIPVAVDTMHHDLLEIPNGNFLTLTTELLEFDKFPTSEFKAEAPWKPAHVVCDTIAEFNPETGMIKEQFHLVDLLDRKRFGYMALSGFWKDKYNHEIPGQCRDWSHANALLYLPEENAVIVSFRHLDCIMKIDWQSKQIHWILGDPGGWGDAWKKHLLKPIGDLQWAYHQHAPQLTPRGTLMMYDNGNYRARPFDRAILAPNNRSRVVEYRIDEDEMTVEQIFAFRGTKDDRFYCPFYCEADWLPKTENILVTDGGHIELSDGTPNDNVPAKRQWARIFEITRSDPPEKVFEVTCDSGLGSRFGWSIYRANRLRNLYDGFDLQPPAENEEVKLFERKRHVKRKR